MSSKRVSSLVEVQSPKQSEGAGIIYDHLQSPLVQWAQRKNNSKKSM